MLGANTRHTKTAARAVAGIRILFMGSFLFSLVRVRRFAFMAHSLPGMFPPKVRNENSKQTMETKTWDQTRGS
jgi:hypothetical protein